MDDGAFESLCQAARSGDPDALERLVALDATTRKVSSSFQKKVIPVPNSWWCDEWRWSAAYRCSCAAVRFLHARWRAG